MTGFLTERACTITADLRSGVSSANHRGLECYPQGLGSLVIIANSHTFQNVPSPVAKTFPKLKITVMNLTSFSFY